jgi:DNA-binding Lrp family transcriptional regulator
MLGQEEGWQLTNRELAQKLAVDPGHLHFHVRMLHKAGLIELVDGGDRKRREKPYRSVAKAIRVGPELLASGGAAGLQNAMGDEVQRALAVYGPQGLVRSVQVTINLSLDRAREIMIDAIEKAKATEEDTDDVIVLTMFAAPPTTADGPAS